jgi:hypothetical protein
MGWGLAAGWLAAAGTTLLTVGTGVQAWAALREYKFLRRSIPEAAWDAISEAAVSASALVLAQLMTLSLGLGSRSSRWVPDWVSVLVMYVKWVSSASSICPGISLRSAPRVKPRL